jgi:hypothetical protein
VSPALQGDPEFWALRWLRISREDSWDSGGSGVLQLELPGGKSMFLCVFQEKCLLFSGKGNHAVSHCFSGELQADLGKSAFPY